MGRPAAYAGAYVSQSPSQSLSGVGSLRENTPFHGSETRTEPSARSSHIQNFCVVEGLGGVWCRLVWEGCGLVWEVPSGSDWCLGEGRMAGFSEGTGSVVGFPTGSTLGVGGPVDLAIR